MWPDNEIISNQYHLMKIRIKLSQKLLSKGIHPSYLNDKILEASGKGLLGFPVFAGCQKAFDTVGCNKSQKLKAGVF